MAKRTRWWEWGTASVCVGLCLGTLKYNRAATSTTEMEGGSQRWKGRVRGKPLGKGLGGCRGPRWLEAWGAGCSRQSGAEEKGRVALTGAGSTPPRKLVTVSSVP